MTCNFLLGEADTVARLVQGQTVTVKGREDTNIAFLVTLRDCIFVGNEQSQIQESRLDSESIFVDTPATSPGHGDLVEAQLRSASAEVSVGKGESTVNLDGEILSYIEKAVETGLSPEDQAQAHLMRGGVFQRQSRPT